MSAVPEHFMREPPAPRAHLRLVDRPAERPPAEDRPVRTFWHWFAVGVLFFCWIAEASLCAQRGF